MPYKKGRPAVWALALVLLVSWSFSAPRAALGEDRLLLNEPGDGQPMSAAVSGGGALAGGCSQKLNTVFRAIFEEGQP
ncbi:MAG: hypothetical protein VB099_00275 [Candidatus Limiplasma sp.]|nr:hypothetical protein [Candidatus Limiplasma sp.]